MARKRKFIKHWRELGVPYDSKDCPCRGENKECLRCGGYGKIRRTKPLNPKSKPNNLGTIKIPLAYIPEPEPLPERLVPSDKDKKVKRNPRAAQERQITPKSDLRYESPKQVRAMDHTKPYYDPYREEGKFGSHPSHDGFDDESKP